MIYQIINSDKKIEKFIKDNFNLPFVKVKEEDKSVGRFCSIILSKQLKKLVSNISNYSLIDLAVNPFKNQTIPQTFQLNSIITKYKENIIYIYNGSIDGVIENLSYKYDITYICLDLNNKESINNFLSYFEKFKKDEN